MFSEVNPLKIIVTVVFKFDSPLLLASSISFKIAAYCRSSSFGIYSKFKIAFKI